MSSFYSYKQEPKIWATFEFPSSEFRAILSTKISELTPIGRLTYGIHWLINGRAFASKQTLSENEIVPAVLSQVEADFNWAKSKGCKIELRLGSHIDDGFGISVFLCLKAPDATEQGWVMLEQVVLKRTSTQFSLWRYDDNDKE